VRESNLPINDKQTTWQSAVGILSTCQSLQGKQLISEMIFAGSIGGGCRPSTREGDMTPQTYGKGLKLEYAEEFER